MMRHTIVTSIIIIELYLLDCIVTGSVMLILTVNRVYTLLEDTVNTSIPAGRLSTSSVITELLMLSGDIALVIIGLVIIIVLIKH